MTNLLKRLPTSSWRDLDVDEWTLVPAITARSGKGTSACHTSYWRGHGGLCASHWWDLGASHWRQAKVVGWWAAVSATGASGVLAPWKHLGWKTCMFPNQEVCVWGGWGSMSKESVGLHRGGWSGAVGHSPWVWSQLLWGWVSVSSSAWCAWVVRLYTLANFKLAYLTRSLGLRSGPGYQAGGYTWYTGE